MSGAADASRPTRSIDPSGSRKRKIKGGLGEEEAVTAAGMRNSRVAINRCIFLLYEYEVMYVSQNEDPVTQDALIVNSEYTSKEDDSFLGITFRLTK